MTYIIKRTDGMYLADMRKSPDGHSYTRKLEFAQMFQSYDSAITNCCENEYPISLSQILGIQI